MYTESRTRNLATIERSSKLIAEWLVNAHYCVASPTLVGSHALGVEVLGSDIDFVVPVPDENREELAKSLSEKMEFRGERQAGISTTRLLYCTRVDDTHIDLNVMGLSDYHHLCDGLRRAAKELTNLERATIIADKMRLKQKGANDALDAYKCDLYRRYCPDLVWLPDYIIREQLAKKMAMQNTPLPEWMLKKLKSQMPQPEM